MSSVKNNGGSSDDDFTDNLQLADRLRINRGEKMKSYRRQKTFHDDQSSSSSSLEIRNEPPKTAASGCYPPYNKKRQNGDKNTEPFANPKRTCLSSRFRKSPDFQLKKKPHMEHFCVTDFSPCAPINSTSKDLFADKTYEDHLHNLVGSENSGLTKQYPKKTILNNLSEQPRPNEDITYLPPNDSESPHSQKDNPPKVNRNDSSDSDVPKIFSWRGTQNNLGDHSRSAENRTGISEYTDPQVSQFFQNQFPNVSSDSVVHYVDSASDEDSRAMLKNGALKGGKQSPEMFQNHKKVLNRKVKKVLDSDDTDDEEEWPTLNPRRPRLLFSSSDSDEDEIGRNLAQNTSDASGNIANHSLPTTSGCTMPKKEFQCHKKGESFRAACFSGDGCYAGAASSSPPLVYHSKSPSRSYRNRKNSRSNATSELTTNNFHPNRSSGGAARGRSRINAGERCTRRSGSPHPGTLLGCTHPRNLTGSTHPKNLPDSTHSRNVSGSTHSRNSSGSTHPRILPNSHHHRTSPGTPRVPMATSDSAKGRSLACSRTRRANIDTAYPDIFDAEDSSEVEFFTANSYSDTETSAESFGGLRISTTVRNPDNNGVICEHSINVGSSDDEISVVFSTGPSTRNGEPRRGTSRTLGRRHNRGSRRHLPNPQEIVSLSPDPVEQVRQVEDDERFARMLQAQFDAEVDHDHVPPRVTHPPYHYDITNAPMGDTDTEFEDSIDNEFDWNPPPQNILPFGVLPTSGHRRGFRTNRTPIRPTTPNIFGSIFYHPRRLDRNRRRLSSHDPRNHIARLFEASLIGYPFSDFHSSDDSFEINLGIAEMNGDVPRGLQKGEINRLPTRKYYATSFAGSSNSVSEIPHRRAELNKECQVCLSDYENGDTLRILPCFHEFHTPCIDPWLKINHTCPVCRVVVDLES